MIYPRPDKGYKLDPTLMKAAHFSPLLGWPRL